MMSLWDALRMNMMISYQELVRTFLSKVAKVCGYASVSYFTYVFRRYFGVSPSQYSQSSSESKILTHQGI